MNKFEFEARISAAADPVPNVAQSARRRTDAAIEKIMAEHPDANSASAQLAIVKAYTTLNAAMITAYIESNRIFYAICADLTKEQAASARQSATQPEAQDKDGKTRAEALEDIDSTIAAMDAVAEEMRREGNPAKATFADAMMLFVKGFAEMVVKATAEEDAE